MQWIEAQRPALLPAGAGPAVRMGNSGGLWIEFTAPPAAELMSAAVRALRLPEGRSSC